MRIDILQKKAFTLAEVLITLAIIGVVASLTIPTLMNNVQKHSYVVALKKFYTTQEDGWSRMMAEEGVNTLEDTSLFQGGSCYLYSFMGCDTFVPRMQKYFHVTSVVAPSYKYTLLNGGEGDDLSGKTFIVFPDGAMLISGSFYNTSSVPTADQITAIKNGGGHFYSTQGNFTVDINGFKKPNVLGRDVFDFFLSSDGKLYSSEGKDYSLFIYGDLSKIWENNPNYCGVPGSNNASSSDGFCLERIIDEGWQMNY